MPQALIPRDHGPALRPYCSAETSLALPDVRPQHRKTLSARLYFVRQRRRKAARDLAVSEKTLASPTTKTSCIQTRRAYLFFTAKITRSRTAAGVKSAGVRGRSLGAATSANADLNEPLCPTGLASSRTPLPEIHFAPDSTSLSDSAFAMPCTQNGFVLRVRRLRGNSQWIFNMASPQSGYLCLKRRSKALGQRFTAFVWALCNCRHVYTFVNALQIAIVFNTCLEQTCGAR